MSNRFRPRGWPLGGWYVLSGFWLIFMVLLGSLMLFRMLKTAGSAQLIQFEEIPLLHFFDVNYPTLLWSTAGLAVVVIAGLAWACNLIGRHGFRWPGGELQSHSSRRRVRAWLPGLAVLFVLIALLECRYSSGREAGGPDVEPMGAIGWLTVLLAAIVGSMMIREVTFIPRGGFFSCPNTRTAQPRVVRLAIVFLFGFVATLIEAIWAHWCFWSPASNGNHVYTVFFAAGELREANLVLYSTSMTLASLAAFAGCGSYLVFHRLLPFYRSSAGVLSRRDCFRTAGLLAGLWTFVLGVPWQIKILPEIRAEDGWIMPAVVLVCLWSGLGPLLAVNLVMLKSDFEGYSASRNSFTAAELSSKLPRPSQYALWTLLLFPIYPCVRWLILGLQWIPRIRVRNRWRYGLLVLLSAGTIVALMYVVTCVTDWFEFDDWRDMLRGAEFPFLKVFLSLITAYFIYLIGRRLRETLRQTMSTGRFSHYLQWFPAFAHAIVLASACGCLIFASWPFWGWSHVPKNVFARCVEFSDRHKFELTFLHWLFDCDRDHYAAVLHGADPDDFDPNIQAGGLGPPEVVTLPVDELAVENPDKARVMPNVVIFFLEGVIPRSIGAYGQRQLAEGLDPTPNIDAVAAEGTIFTQARCFYPSTWDAWYAVNTGRFMRIAEMHAAELFGDRYSPHNNLYKVLDLAGIDRWCHADTEPYANLMVPGQFHKARKPAWQPHEVFDSSLSTEDEELGIWRGDKRMQRIVDFIDDLQPGERFFVCEHMSDTHFPWRRTSAERAAELGFPQRLEPYEADAILPGGLDSDIYHRYYQTITRMDAQIGKVLDKLRQRSLYDSTMVVIVSDHGCQWWEHERLYYVSHLYDASLLVPLIIRVPGLAGGGKCEEPVLQIDLVPTLMEMAGMRHVNSSVTGPLPGRSLLPALREKESLSTEVAKAYRHRDVPLLTHYNMLGVIRNFQYKLIFYRPLGTYLLFDLQEDPSEMSNLSDARPELLEDMLGRLRSLFDENKTLLGRIR
jgi:hypothetical protein